MPSAILSRTIGPPLWPQDLKFLSSALSLPVFVAEGLAFAALPLPVFVAGIWAFAAQPLPVFVARMGLHRPTSSNLCVAGCWVFVAQPLPVFVAGAALSWPCRPPVLGARGWLSWSASPNLYCWGLVPASPKLWY